MDLHDALMVRSGQVATGGGESMSGGMEGAAGVGGRGKGEENSGTRMFFYDQRPQKRLGANAANQSN